MLRVNLKNTQKFIAKHELDFIQPQIQLAHDQIEHKTSPGQDYLGWVNLPTDLDKAEYEQIKVAAEKIRSHSDVLVVIGIGGSYLGARAVIEGLGHHFSSLLKDKKNPEVIFAGNHMSPGYLEDLFEAIQDKDVSVNVISKSGTTTEPAIAFRLFKKYLEDRYGVEESVNRIFVTTDANRGALKSLSDEAGYTTFVIPDDVGGRFSVLTPVGLLPIAVAGVDIDQLLKGAADAQAEYKNPDITKNPCYLYAAARNCLLRQGYDIEILVNYEPSMQYISEWWKQLFGESEGKDGKGLYPASVNNSSDLHSMGQFIQNGRRNLFETVIKIDQAEQDIKMQAQAEDADGLNFLANMNLHDINNTALDATVLAHVSGGVPNVLISIEKKDAYHLGNLLYFFEKACGISACLNAVNPFDQPGVEAYKKNMFALLGKPGFEELKNELLKEINK